MFLTKIKQAGMERAHIPEKDRKDFYIYVDEFQNVVTQTFENILSEARKYGLNLTMAHQYVGQIQPKIYQSIPSVTSDRLFLSVLEEKMLLV